jgi:flagellar hook protein FlgE
MSSLFAALGVAVSGLNAQSQSIGNISDNLSNAETTGYKSIGTSFSDLVTASSATDNSPGGVMATPSYQNDVQGNIAATSTTTNLAISGQGFFNVTSAVQSSAGQTQFTGTELYTRDGDFTLNKDGYMVNSAGYYLQGYTITGGAPAATPTPIQISSLLDSPVPTTTVTYAANLPAGAPTNYTSTPATVNVYDSQGSTHPTQIVWTPVLIGSTDAQGNTVGANTWQATVTVADGGNGANTGLTSGVNYVATFDVAFAANGTTSSIAGETSYYQPAADAGTTNNMTNIGTPVASPAINGSAATVSLGDESTNATTGNLKFFQGAASQTVTLNLGTYGAATGVTQFSDSSAVVSVSSISQDGLGKGSYSNIGISTDGIVSINYTNGSTREIYQIPIATFNSPDNLQRITGGVYSQTLSSGTRNLNAAGTNGAGKVASSSLESSDVDIASEFTTMIQAQQVYSANAKLVTTVNSMLNTIIQAVQ